MKQKMSIKEQVALLTPEQKKKIRKYEIIEGVITLVLVVPLLIFLFNTNFKYWQIMDSNASFFVKQEAFEQFKGDMIVYFAIIAVIAILYAIFYFAFVKKKMPYYSFGKAFYLLTHKVK